MGAAGRSRSPWFAQRQNESSVPIRSPFLNLNSRRRRFSTHCLFERIVVEPHGAQERRWLVRIAVLSKSTRFRDEVKVLFCP